jgi:hypothetical protein
MTAWREAMPFAGKEKLEVISSFPPHVPALGHCEAHFVGLNTKQFNWSRDGVDPLQITRDHWSKMALLDRLGLVTTD